MKGYQLWSSTRQYAWTSALSATLQIFHSPSIRTTTATYAEDTAILATHKNYIEASQRLQESLFYIQKWLKK